jgi:hypothetical protein
MKISSQLPPGVLIINGERHIPQTSLAVICGVDPSLLQGLRHNKVVGAEKLGASGGRGGVCVYSLDHSAVVMMAMEALGMGASPPRAMEIGWGLGPTLFFSVLGRVGVPGKALFGAEVRRRDGSREFALANGEEEAALATRMLGQGEARGVMMFNLSEIGARLSLGFTVAAIGEEEARAEYEARLADLPPKAHEEFWAEFEAVALRLRDPTLPRPKRRPEGEHPLRPFEPVPQRAVRYLGPVGNA